MAERWSTATGVSLSSPTIRWRLLHRELRARVPLYRTPYVKPPAGACVYNELVDIDTGVPIGNKSPFPMNPALIRGTVMAASALDAILVNATFRNMLSEVILDERQA